MSLRNHRNRKNKYNILFEFQQGLCHYCKRQLINRFQIWPHGTPPKSFRMNKSWATFDHVVPKSEGGTSRLENLVLACSECNQKKGSKAVDDFILKRD